MDITILMDNEALSHSFLKEHGFSCLIETHCEGRPVRILFDTGASDKFITNAARLDLNLKSSNFTLISHGHYDHGGGLNALLKEAPYSQIYLSDKAFAPLVKGDPGEKYFYSEKSLGLKESLLNSHRDNFHLLGEETKLEENITVITELEESHPRPANSRLCTIGEDGKMIEDSFDHEIYLAVEEEENLFIFTGCAHRGVVNIMSMAQEKFPHKKSYTMVGGFHLKGETGTEQVDLLSRFLNKTSCPWRLITGHCTGTEAYSQLKERLGDRVEYGKGGMSFHLD